jgi:nicotinamidase-related amidase
MTDTALLVIDAQESFRQRANWHEVDSQTYLSNQQALIDGAQRKGWKIVRVFHAEPEGIFPRLRVSSGRSPNSSSTGPTSNSRSSGIPPLSARRLKSS